MCVSWECVFKESWADTLAGKMTLRERGYQMATGGQTQSLCSPDLRLSCCTARAASTSSLREAFNVRTRMAYERPGWEDAAGGGARGGDLLRTQEGVCLQETRARRRGPHLVEEHHRGFDDLSPLLELSIVVLLLGL